MYISRSDDYLAGVNSGTCMQNPKRESDYRFGLVTGTLPPTTSVSIIMKYNEHFAAALSPPLESVRSLAASSGDVGDVEIL